jgi:hypothetical protein
MRKPKHVVSGFRSFLGFSLLIATASISSLHAQTADRTNPWRGGQHIDHPIQVLRRVSGPNHTVTLLRFNYATGTASRVVVDESSKKILREQKFPGRPQSSRQEFEEAVHIIGRDQDLAALMTHGAVPEGGFIVDGPSGHPANDRYIQVRLLSPDRRTLLRVTLVDLTAEIVASARTSFE